MFIKHILDKIFGIILLLLLSPILAIIAIAIRVDSKGPVIFKQKRLGKDGQIFEIYKFRTMYVDAPDIRNEDGSTFNSDNDPRVTKVGKILRKTSLDELSQIFNILKGEMSFIGPRPALTYHPWSFSEYTDEQKKMFSVRPGITGWAQVHGRKDVEWHKRIELNVWYTEHVSFLLDLKILFLTVYKVIMMKDNDNVTTTVKTAENEE